MTRHFWLYLVLFVAGGCLTACDDDDSTVTPADQTLRRLVVVYIAAENSLTNYAQSDLDEMVSGRAGIPSDCALAVYFDNSQSGQSPTVSLIDSDNGQTTLKTFSDDPVSTDSASMQETLTYIVNSVPAREYALVLWSHGSGWLPEASDRRNTWGVDNGRNNTSDNGQQMALTTLTHVLENVGVHWQYILYDACFMQCVEVAFQLRQVTDWSIGSPAEIPAYGAPYDSIMAHLFQADDFARDIPQSYHDWYEAHYSTGVILSSIRSSQLDALLQATASALDTLDDFPTTGVQKYCAYASSTNWLSEFYDMASLMGHWLGTADYQTWAAAMQQAIPYRFATHRWETAYSAITPVLSDTTHFAATSMYLPQEGRTSVNALWRQLDWGSALNY